MGTSTAGSGYIYELLRALDVSVPTARHVQDLLLRPITVLLLLLGTWLLSRVGARLIRRGLARVRDRATRGGDAAQASRVDTVRRILANAWRVAVAVIGAITVLSVLGINLAPFLAGATVIGATIGFGAQSLVRDFLSGFLILLEDQYRIGDVVVVGDISGVVDEVSLRVTRLRGPEGTLWYVPNGEIRRLGNNSRHWSRALVRSVIAVGTPIEDAHGVIADAARAVLARPEIGARALGEPKILGVSDVSATGITIDLEVRTAPLAGDEVARALREEITNRLGRAQMLPPPAEPRGLGTD